MTASEQASRGYLTATEAVAVFKSALNDELGLATAGWFSGEGTDDRTHKVLETAYRIASQLDYEATTVSAFLLNAFSQGFSEADRRAVVLMLKAPGPQLSVRRIAEQALKSASAPINVATVRDAGIQILLAKAEAQARARLIDHPSFTASGDSLSRLLSDEAILVIRSKPPLPSTVCPKRSVGAHRMKAH